MPRPKVSVTELAHQVVREAREPLTINEIVAGVLTLAGGPPTKDPKATVRNALTQSRAIISLGNGTYGWKARMINGVTLRHVLYEEDLKEHQLIVGEAIRDLLLPNFHMNAKYGVRGAAQIALENGPTVSVEVRPMGLEGSLLDAGPQFWEWLNKAGAAVDDSLILSCIDGEARLYAMHLEPGSARDDNAIAQRDAEVLAVAVGFLRGKRGQAPIWDTVSFVNACGVNHKPVPSDPFEDIWTEDIWGPVLDECGTDGFMTAGIGGQTGDLFDMLFNQGEETTIAPQIPSLDIVPENVPPGVDPNVLQQRILAIYGGDTFNPISTSDPMYAAINRYAASVGLPSPSGKLYRASDLIHMFGNDDVTLDWIDDGIALGMVEADMEYDQTVEQSSHKIIELPTVRGKKVPSARTASAQAKERTEVYSLRISYRYSKNYWFELEIGDDQMLEELHLAIQRELRWDNDHLYSFFMGPKPYVQRVEIGSPYSDSARHTTEVTLGDLKLKEKQKFLYLFDYGDDHLFDIRVEKINSPTKGVKYPKVQARHGKRPVQYEDFEDEE